MGNNWVNPRVSKIPKVTENKWVQGVPTPVVHGSMSPNEQAITLLAGFSNGSVTMDGDSIKHLPSIPEKSITQTLNEVWGTPKRKRNNNGNTIRTKRAKIAQKEPKMTIARQLTKEKPHTKILDLEIRPENIIPGSPLFIPYKREKPKGKGKHVKNIKINAVSVTTSDSDMPKRKSTKTKAELEKEARDRIKAKNRASRARRSADVANGLHPNPARLKLQASHPVSNSPLKRHIEMCLRNPGCHLISVACLMSDFLFETMSFLALYTSYFCSW